MSSERTGDVDPTAALLEALLPILHRIHIERTLSPGKMGILRYLARQQRASTAELTVAVRVSPQAISLATRELEAMGLVERVQDDHDRRRSWFHLTEVGQHKIAQETHIGRTWLYQVVQDRLTPEDRAALAAAVPVLHKLTEEPSPETPGG